MTKSERLLKDAVAEAEAAATKETALAKAPEGDTALLAGVDEDIALAIKESMDDIEPVLPFARLRQRSTGDDGEVLGGLRFNDGRPDEALPMEVLILFTRKTRALWPAEYQEGDVLLCKSDDGVAPRSDVENPPAKECAACPMSQWPTAEDRAAKVTRSACHPGMNLLVATPDLADAFVVNFPTSALRPLNGYLSRLKRKQIKTGKGLFGWVTELDSEIERGSRGTYYIPQLTLGPEVDADTWGFLASEVRAYGERMKRSVEQAEVPYEPENGGDASEAPEEPGPFNV